MSDDTCRQFMSALIEKKIADTHIRRRNWSIFNTECAVIVIVFSAFAAIISQYSQFSLSGLKANDIVTILTITVTIISTMQSKLGFENRWIAQRMTNSAYRQLQIDDKLGASDEVIAKGLKDIIEKHAQAIACSHEP